MLTSRINTVTTEHYPRRTLRSAVARCMLRWWWGAAATRWFAPDRTSMQLITTGLGERGISRRPAASFVEGVVCHRASATPISKLPILVKSAWACTSVLQPPKGCFLGWHNRQRDAVRSIHATNAAQLERSAVQCQDYDASQIQVVINDCLPSLPSTCRMLTSFRLRLAYCGLTGSRLLPGSGGSGPCQKAPWHVYRQHRAERLAPPGELAAPWLDSNQPLS